MREIKFRAWDVINKKMYPTAFPTWNGMTEGKIDFVNHSVEVIDEDGDDKPVLMQFTGLIDKNGKEIYEGDVCRWVINGISEIGIVDFPHGFGGYDLKNLEDEHHVCNDWLRGEYEVIGNIYEHKDFTE